jgi:protein-S-isoprenylcysteine O-methyltransferase
MTTLDPPLRLAIHKHRMVFVEIAVTAFALGVVAAVACVGLAGALFFSWWTWTPQVTAFGLYLLVCVVGFHMSEFLVAAVFRPHDTHPKAFMIYHSPAYTIASFAAVAEFLVETYLIPSDWKLVEQRTWFALVAAVAVVFFYGIRVLAMVQCGPNFSLEVETTHREEHQLVTTGVFQYLRHPSYFGWFWRTVLSQVLLLNPVCFLGFTYVTWKFFVDRIAEEEEILSSDAFFGEKYRTYRKSVRTGIPWIV